MEEKDFKELDLNFVTVLPGDLLVEIIPRGAAIKVTFEEKVKYCELIKKVHIFYLLLILKNIREGFFWTLPKEHIIAIKPQQLKTRLTGSSYVINSSNSQIDLDYLKKITRFNPNNKAKLIFIFWAVLESFDQKQLCMFMKFATGRPALSYTTNDDLSITFRHSRKDRPKTSKMPKASTCSNTLIIDSIVEESKLKKDLLYAMEHCEEITDDDNFMFQADFND